MGAALSSAGAWRTGQHWLRTVTEPTPQEASDHAPNSVIWSHCWRCGGRNGIALPADIRDVCIALRAFIEAHRDCAQTLRGARWELIVTLRLRQWALLAHGAVL